MSYNVVIRTCMSCIDGELHIVRICIHIRFIIVYVKCIIVNPILTVCVLYCRSLYGRYHLRDLNELDHELNLR